MQSIKVQGLTKFFGTVAAVDEVSFDVEAGELMTLLGPSGCGKTTTLRLIAGLEKLDAGEIRVGDRLVSDPARGISTPPEKRGMGMVFQSYALWPHMTVFENVAYPLKMRRVGRSEIRDRVLRVLDSVGLTGFHDRPSPFLSGGQAQRVALARALVFDPDVLLLDEPLSNLDAKLREEMRFELKAIQARVGVTALFVTHDQAEAMVLSDRVIVMNGGHVEQAGRPAEVYDQPATRFVMDFLGQVNHLSGRVVRGADGGLVARVPDAAGGGVPLPAGSAWSEDEAVVLAFRPQDVRLRPADGGTEWIGAVEAVAYLGTHTEYLLRLGETNIRVVDAQGTPLVRGDLAVCELAAPAVRVWRA